MPHITKLFAILATIASMFAATPLSWALTNENLDTVVSKIRGTALDVDRAGTIEDLEVDLGMGVLHLEKGLLVPGRPIDGQTFELVFIGEAQFRLDPPDDIEAGQLELFTGLRSLTTPLEHTVLVSGNPEIARALLDRATEQAPTEEQLEKFTDLYSAWVSGPVRRGSGAEAAMLKSLAGDGASRGYFSSWCVSQELGDFYYVFDPTQDEQVELGQFIPLENEELLKRIKRIRRKEFKKGRLAELSDLGLWDTWVSTSLHGEDGRVRPGVKSFEPRHYEIDLTLQTKEERAQGRVRLSLVATRDESRVVTLQLHPTLRVESVRGADSEELFWFRSNQEIHIRLPRVVASDEEVTLDIEYGGAVLDRLEGGVWALRTTSMWHPRVETEGRATYDVTLRWRDKYRFEVLAAGTRVDGGREDGVRWERRKLDVPAMAYTFEVGKFDIREIKVGHVAVTVGFSTLQGQLDPGVKDEVLDTIAKVLPYYEERFGPYPLDVLTVATVPRGFSQGFLGFVTLADALIRVPSGYVAAAGVQARRRERIETVAHEIAHQWWGNKVGWRTYRDQWLSEALAEYSAVLFASEQAPSRAVYLKERSSDWRLEIALSDASNGPVVLGHRLASSQSLDAYQSIVYTKGSVVFSMLATSLGEGPFLQMLRHLADRTNNQVIDTELFLLALERMSGADLSGFAELFIYGTEMPYVEYTYEFKPRDGGGWVIEGQARPIRIPPRQRTMNRPEGGSWQITSERQAEEASAPLSLIVPFQVLVSSGDQGKKRKKGAAPTARGLGGNVRFQGADTRFVIPLDSRPQQFWLDQRGVMYARFVDIGVEPKSYLRRRAGREEPTEALATLRLALESPVLSERARQEADLSNRKYEELTQLEDARIYLAMTECHLELGEVAKAESTFERSRNLLLAVGGAEHERGFDRAAEKRVRLRLMVQQGQYDDAYRELRKEIRRSRYSRPVEHALFAVSAFETGHRKEAEEAAGKAEAGGIDMASLTALIE